jgi:hypothetical protein
MKRIVLIVMTPLIVMLFACEHSKKVKDNTLDSDIVNNPVTANNADTSKKFPIFKFVEESFNFGNIKEGQKVHHTFKFKNVGNADLIISNAHGSCGCTIPTFSSAPVAPNDEGMIEVTFNSEGKSGDNRKTVTIISNTVPNSHVLEIKGYVKAKD